MKRTGVSPQVRTRQYLAKQGYLVGTLEQTKHMPDPTKQPCVTCGTEPQIIFRSDLFGAFDVIGIHPTQAEVILVQCTSGANHSSRKMKVLACMEAKLCLLAGVRIMVQSWTQDVDSHWQHRDEWITLADYKQAPHYPSDVRTLMEIKRKAKRPDLPPGTSLKFNPIKDSEVPF